MIYLDQHIQDQITDLVEACTRYWELRGVASEHRYEMRLELEDHFVQAALDGKAPEVVIGPNPPAFAEHWAREMHPRMVRGGRVIIPSLVYAFSIVSTTALVQQVLARASSFTLTLFTAFLLVSGSLFAWLHPFDGFLAHRVKTRQGREALILAITVLAALALREAGIRVNWSMALLNWSWPLTLALFALAVILFSLSTWRTTRQKQEAISLSLIRSVLLFVGKVAACDVLLFVGSLVVFNVCVLAARLR
jgi:hypothetical protein